MHVVVVWDAQDVCSRRLEPVAAGVHHVLDDVEEWDSVVDCSVALVVQLSMQLLAHCMLLLEEVVPVSVDPVVPGHLRAPGGSAFVKGPLVHQDAPRCVLNHQGEGMDVLPEVVRGRAMSDPFHEGLHLVTRHISRLEVMADALPNRRGALHVVVLPESIFAGWEANLAAHWNGDVDHHSRWETSIRASVKAVWTRLRPWGCWWPWA